MALAMENVYIACAVLTAIESGVSILLQRATPQRYSRLISGSPIWSWWVGGFHQAIVFPAIIVLAILPVLEGRITPQAWIHSLWDGPEGAIAQRACSHMHIALLSYWLKDCFTVHLSPLIWVHHFICLGAVYVSMAGHLTSSDACFALGATLLELGSLANTVCELRPGWSVRLVWTPLMVLSNASASLLVIWYAWTFNGHGTDASWWCAAVVGTGLSFMRQREWQMRLRQDKVNWKKDH